MAKMKKAKMYKGKKPKAMKGKKPKGMAPPVSSISAMAEQVPMPMNMTFKKPKV